MQESEILYFGLVRNEENIHVDKWTGGGTIPLNITKREDNIMKKILIVLLALACLFGAVSCKDTLDKVYDLPAFNPAAGTEQGLIMDIFGGFMSDGFELQSKKTEITLCSPKVEDLPVSVVTDDIEGTLTAVYTNGDTPTCKVTFKGSFDGENGTVCFDVLPATGLPDSSTIEVKSGSIDLEDFTTFILQAYDMYGIYNPGIVKYIEGSSVSELAQDANIADGLTLLAGSQVKGEFSSDRADYFDKQQKNSLPNPATMPFELLFGYGKGNFTYKIDAKYKEGDGPEKRLQATVRYIARYDYSDCCDAMPTVVINYKGKDYLIPNC